MDWKNPITLSLIALVVATVISVAVFVLWKPASVVNVDDQKNKNLNWGKLISLSVVLGLVSAIVIFISTMKEIPATIELDPVAMGFGTKVANNY